MLDETMPSNRTEEKYYEKSFSRNQKSAVTSSITNSTVSIIRNTVNDIQKEAKNFNKTGGKYRQRLQREQPLLTPPTNHEH